MDPWHHKPCKPEPSKAGRVECWRQHLDDTADTEGVNVAVVVPNSHLERVLSTLAEGLESACRVISSAAGGKVAVVIASSLHYNSYNRLF
jgi:hypothetical protein